MSQTCTACVVYIAWKPVLMFLYILVLYAQCEGVRMLIYISDIFLSKHTFFAVCVIMTERLHDSAIMHVLLYLTCIVHVYVHSLFHL